MKKILQSAIVLFVFALAVAVVQVSCNKTNAGNARLMVPGKVLYHITVNNGVNLQYWICDYDGSNTSQINFNLPPNVSIDQSLQHFITPKLSPDGTKIFFQAKDTTLPMNIATGIYSADINGSNVTKIVVSSPGVAGNLFQLDDVN